jgi:peptidoglycan/LPS O-acetylase OafA/YrhL
MFLFVLGHLLRPSQPSRQARGALRNNRGVALLLLGFALCATKDWQVVERFRQALCTSELACTPSLFQFQSQLGAIALYLGVLLSPLTWPFLGSAPCRQLGRLSFSIYLLHFPILFTIVCLTYTVLPSVGVAFAVFLAVTLVAAIGFERTVDRPAIALSRRLDARQRRNSFTSASA